MRRLISALATGAICALPAIASAGEVRIGLITSITGTQADSARQMLDGVNLALKQMGGKIAGLDAKLFVADDQEKPDIARQAADRMLESDKVDFIAGPVATNQVITVTQPVVDADKIMISTGAGPSVFTGAKCSPNFYSVSFENVSMGRVTGEAANGLGIKRIAIMAWNTPGARDLVEGFKSGFKGQVVFDTLTPTAQQDFAGEISRIRAAKPDGLYYFYPGSAGVNFAKQLAQFGANHEMKVITQYISMDRTMLSQVGDAADGMYVTVYYTESLDNPANKEFVAAFRAAYGHDPADYGAQGYDLIHLLESALTATKGDMSHPTALRHALEAAKFTSVRGPFSFNTNHFPIESYYLSQITKGAGESRTYKVQATYPEQKDTAGVNCHMPQS